MRRFCGLVVAACLVGCTAPAADGVAWVDADLNGVRDDIDRFIADSNLTPEQVQAATQLAVDRQKVFLLSLQDPDTARQLASASWNRFICVGSGLTVASADQFGQELDRIIARGDFDASAYAGYTNALNYVRARFGQGEVHCAS